MGEGGGGSGGGVRFGDGRHSDQESIGSGGYWQCRDCKVFRRRLEKNDGGFVEVQRASTIIRQELVASRGNRTQLLQKP